MTVSPETFGSEIAEIVLEHFRQTGSAIFLSRLGQELGKRGYVVKDFVGREGLASFVRNELSAKIQLISSLSNEKILAALPSDVDATGDTSRFFTVHASDGDAGFVKTRLQVNRRLWAAFSVPIADGLTRVIALRPEIHFEDVHVEAAASGNKLTIPSELIVPIGSVEPDKRNVIIVNNIERWMDRSNVSSSDVKPTKKGEPRDQNNRSVLDVIIGVLSESDRSRVVLPLDIVGRLLGTKLP